MPDSTISYIQVKSAELLENLSKLAINAGTKYAYYNADQRVVDLGVSLPQKFRFMKPGVGWASRAVTTISDRINFDSFAHDTFGINGMLDNADAFTVFNNAKTDALIAGCSFIATLPDSDGGVRLLPFTATEATGIVNPRTNLLEVGLAVVRWYPYSESDQVWRKWGKVGLIPADYLLFTPEYTAHFVDNALTEVIPNKTGRPLLHVLTHRQSADRPFGKSRITNTVRRIVDEVTRLKVRYEIASEFYSTPQRYATGLAEGGVTSAELDAAMGKVWAITKDEDGEKPEIGQLPQMSISQFSDQKKDLARDFCAETALTLRNLGYETANPTSAESLSAMSDDLLLEAQESQRELGKEFKEIAITMRLVMDGNSVVPTRLKEIDPTWRPLFQIDFGSAGDAANKLIQAMPELAGTTTLYRMLGMGAREAEELARSRANTRPSNFMASEEQ